MRGKGINYDTGAHPAGGCTRTSFDSATVRREMQIIADDLHCTAVRISGGDPDRLSIAAEHAADAGLEVWFAPFPCELTSEQMLAHFVECAARAEQLRRRGASVVLVTGSIDTAGRSSSPSSAAAPIAVPRLQAHEAG